MAWGKTRKVRGYIQRARLTMSIMQCEQGSRGTHQELGEKSDEYIVAREGLL